MPDPERRIHTLISDVTYGSNIGGAMRTSHVLGGGELYVHDPRRILQASEDEIRRFSANNYDLAEFKVVEDLLEFLRTFPGRKIATALSSRSVPLPDFQFQPDDLILFGNERVGLSDEVIEACNEAVIIPMLGTPYSKTDYHPGEPITGVGTFPSFNVSISHAIVTYQALAQIGAFEGYQFTALAPQE